ncbi:glycine cleavage system T [Fusarium sp. NRRL 52700]|nr:glycine cleavage system T [Fusarium sp. NRRL 52700]
MPEPNAATPDFHGQQNAVPVAPRVPVDQSVNTWSRFITTFEASEFTDWIDQSLLWKKTCYIGDWFPLLDLGFLPNQAKYAIFCRDNGAIIGEGVLMMLDRDNFAGVTLADYQFHHGNRKFNARVDIVSNN